MAGGAGLGAGYYSMKEFELVYGEDKAALEAWHAGFTTLVLNGTRAVPENSNPYF